MKTPFIPTHRGVLCFCNGTLSLRYRVPLRATKCFYVTKYGTRLRKSDGNAVATKDGRGAHHSLDLSTVTEIRQ